MMVNEVVKKIKVPGFKKEGMNWRRNTAELIHVMNCQSSKFNYKDECFTLNIGVFSAEIYELTWIKKLSGRPKETDCVLRARISFFLEENTDKWWCLEDAKSWDKIVLELDILLKDRVLPFLDTIDTHADLKHIWMRDFSNVYKDPLQVIQLACLYKVTGEVDTGVELLQSITSDKTWGENARRTLALF